ncbi:methylated-DNA--[protein]-cysteine S-methyltransferase [Haloferax namakaokahaiae]|uniref:Methylated-DNA--[protein]-cysteine S-methyltransferase n=1 Tax=Haloferax namakaokahaiae TaxID=1748331 RepID=A0ABD5ZDC2_9EURY
MDATIFDSRVAVDESLVDASPETIREQVAEYERGERTEFDIDVRIADDFTGDVMRCMLEIPYGETRTYGEIAARLDSSPVAVGQACGRNPVPLVVPCHRIVGADSLGGFSADGGVSLKRELLTLEGAIREPDSTQATLGEVVQSEHSRSK